MKLIRFTTLLATAVALFSGFGCGPIEDDTSSLVNNQAINAKSIGLENLPANIVDVGDKTIVTDTDVDGIDDTATVANPRVNPAVVPPAPNPINYTGGAPVYAGGVGIGGIGVDDGLLVRRGYGTCCCPLRPERLVANPCNGYCTNVRCYDAENFMVNPSFYDRLYRSLPWYAGTTILNPAVGGCPAAASGCPTAPVSSCPTGGCPL